MARTHTLGSWALGGVVAGSLLGAPACLDLDDYELVEGAGGGGASGGSGSGSGGQDGAGGTACTQTSGTVFATFRTRAAAPTFEAGDGCSAPDGNPGIDVVAVAGALGRCEGHLRLAASAGATFTVLERAQATRDGAFAVAGSLTSGSLDLPLACDGPSRLALSMPPAASDAVFVARFLLQGDAFCTSWVRVLGSRAAPGAVRLTEVEVGDDGSVAITGTLGGGEAFMDDGPTRLSFGGGPFLATFAPGGPLRTFTELEAASSNPGTALGVGFDGASWLAAGATLLDSPACHGCSGSSHVTEAAGVCPESPDAPDSGPPDAAMVDGSSPDAGRDASTDGPVEGRAPADASQDATPSDSGASPDASTPPPDSSPDAPGPEAEAGAPPEPRPDAVNAFVLRSGSGLGCGRLETFGSDADPTDLQAATDVAATRLACGAYVTGLAGVGSFRLDGTDPGSALAPGTDGIADAFLARLAGGPLAGCSGAGPEWSLRATSTAKVTGTKLRADVCNLGAVSTLLVGGSGTRGVSLRRCSSDTSCETTESVVSLGDSGDQGVVMAVDAQGELEWHAAVGPLVLGADTPLGSGTVAAPALDLTSDGADDAYVLFDTRGTPSLHNARLARCDALNVATPPAGLWLVKLDRTGVGAEADCRFAVHLGSGAP